MYKIMANRFSFQESAIQEEPEEPNIIWHEDSNDGEENVEFTTEQDETLPDNMNETYMTAAGDNTTQYFSVLESGDETILHDTGDVGLDQTIQETDEQQAFTVGENSEVVLYRVDGSDELYGVQIGHDESGNLQKYQFKVRQTEEGTLEALSDSIQILPMDSEGIQIGETEDYTEFQQNEVEPENEQVFVKQEQIVDNYMSESNEYAEEEIFEDPPDIKEGILESTNLIVQQKRELFEPSSESDFEFQNGQLEETYYEQPPEEEQQPSEYLPEEQHSEELNISSESVEVNGNIPMYHHRQLLEENGEASEELQEHYEQLFVKESHIVEENGSKMNVGLVTTDVNNFFNDADDENEDYETVEGAHVTGEIDAEDLDDDSIRRGPSFQKNVAKRKVIRNIIRQIKVKDPVIDRPSQFFYVVRDPERGDIVKFHSGTRHSSVRKRASDSKIPVVRTNPRSILKTTLPKIAPKPPSAVVEDNDKYDKRFAKSKEAQQARQFHNYIAQTKIIHAPVRQERLPRKQTIRPMERTDQEIVVQEVVVSSNGYIETSEGGVLKERVPLEPTVFIQLSDTEDEDQDAKRKRKSKKRKSMIEITISDSDDDTTPEPNTNNPQEVTASEDQDSDDEPAPKRPRGRPPKNSTSPETRLHTDSTKKPRGRPPKPPQNDDEISTEDESSPEEEIIVIRIDNKCPKCPKSFPSEGSLRSHMQYHVYSSEMKYICEICGEQFKNSVLLKRHCKAHLTKEFYCGVCKKVFSDQSQLIAHRRTHVKEQMFKATTLPVFSPKRRKIDPIKCPDCNRIFSSVKALEVHAKIHKKFACLSCAATFLSRLTLENHLRKNCVKSPLRRISKVPGIPRLRESVTNVKCDSCPMSFTTYTSLFKHKVSRHELEDENLGVRSSRRTLTRKFSGIPANDRLKAAYLSLRNKLAENN